MHNADRLVQFIVNDVCSVLFQRAVHRSVLTLQNEALSPDIS